MLQLVGLGARQHLSSWKGAKMRDYCWDFDGTLYQTYPVMVKAFKETLQDYGIEVNAQAVYLRMRRSSLGQTFAFYTNDLPTTTQAKVVQDYRQREQQAQKDEHPFSGAREVCKQVVARGGRNFLLTHRDHSAWQLLVRDQLAEFFSGAVTGDAHFPRKPNPASLNYLCTKFGIIRTEAVMVGDRPLDVEAGRRAGMQGYLFDPDQTIIAKIECDRRISELKAVL